MKKMLSILLAMAMMLSLLPTATYAASADDTKFSLTVSKTNIEVGDTFDVTINIAENPGIAAADIELTWPNGAFEVVSSAANSNFSANSELNGARIVFGALATDTTTTGEFYTVTLKALSAGNHDLSMKGYVANATPVEWDPTFVGATVSVSEAATDGYTVSTSAATTTVNNDGTASNVTVNVVVNKAFNSAELKLSYDKDYLTFVSGVPAQTMPDGDPVTITGADGVITIRDYGVGYAAGNAYTLTFTSTKGGVANVAVTSAGFSTKEEAETTDLIPATTGSSASVTINHKVTVNSGTPTYVAPGGTYNGEIPNYDPANNKYDITVTMGGDEQTDPNIGTDGKFAITPVTGELVITYTVTPNTYNITWKDTDNGVENTEEVAQVVYGNPVTFNVAAGKAEDEIEDGYHYDVLVYLTADTNKTPIATSSSENADGSKKYTIAADKITGHITIEVSKVTDEADKVKLDVTDSDEVYYNNQPVTTINVTKNEEITLTLKKEIGYTYKVEQFVGEATTGTELTVNADGTFTVNVGTQPITIKVTKTLNTTSFDVTEYVQLDGTKMWLVKVGNETVKADLEAGDTYRVYTYDEGGENGVKELFWSSKYNAYCYLVVSSETNIETLKSTILSKLSVADGTVTAIGYDGNVNQTFKADGENQVAVIDVNDAQLVWNMYSAVYSEFTDNVTVQKFLEADMDFSGELSTNDAAEVVKLIG